MSFPSADLPNKVNQGLNLLDGVRVVDLTTSIAGPYAGQLLADFGAVVVKVEKPGSGDDCRAWGPPFLDGESLWYQSVNRNKKSITLNISDSEGYAVLKEIVRISDVVLVNQIAKNQKKLAVDYETLCAVREDLIHASITGFGIDGVRADLACYDLIAEGYSGVMDMTGEIDGLPQKVGTPAADMLAGEDAALAILAALFRRSRTGEGARIDISMVESMTRFMAPRLMPHLGSGEIFRRSGGRDSVIAIYQAFETQTDPLTLGLGTDAIWKRFWQAVGAPEFAENSEYGSNAKRRQHRPKLVEKIATVLKSRTRNEWLHIFAEARVPAGPIYRLDEIGSDNALIERGLLYAVDRDGARVPQVGLGITIDGETESCRALPPKLGADNHEVLSGWLGFAEERLAALEARSIV